MVILIDCYSFVFVLKLDEHNISLPEKYRSEDHPLVSP